MRHYIGEIGTDIVLETGVTITTATKLEVKYQKPDGTTGAWTASLDGTTKVKYTLQDGDIDQAGVWTFQSYVEISGGEWRGESVQITFSNDFDLSAFTQLQRVKEMVNQTASDTSDDSMIENLIMQETKKIQNYTRRDLFYGQYTEYYDGNVNTAIFVNNFPIVSVTSLHDDVDREFGSDDLIAPADYYADLSKGIIRLLGGLAFAEGFGNIKVVYYGGFKVIPKDLELACSQLVLADYMEIKGGINVLAEESVTYKPENLRKQAYAVLDRYKKMSLI